MSFSILSTALHLLHLYPHFSIRSEATKFFRQSSKSSPPILYLLGIGNDKSMKLSGTELANFYSELAADFPIVTIEDPFDQDDFENTAALTASPSRNASLSG